MLFLTDVDHVSFEKANETRQNNLQSATVSLQVVIGLCKRKETAALKSNRRFFAFTQTNDDLQGHGSRLEVILPCPSFYFAVSMICTS